VIIIDNFKTHHSKLVNEKAKNLNILLIFLPPYSPDLNPIEFVWKSIKKSVSRISPLDVELLKDVVTKSFYNLTQSNSFAEKWIKYFLNDKFKLFCT